MLIAKEKLSTTSMRFRIFISFPCLRNLRRKKMDEIYASANGISFRLFCEWPKKVGDTANKNRTIIPVP
jgi:hypothetical protein